MIDYLAFTGHRPDKLGGYSATAQRRLVQLARDVIIESKCRCVITGMALGWDQAIAEACCDLWHPFIAAVPIDNHGSNWPERSRRHCSSLLDRATEVVIVSPGKNVRVGPAMQRRNEWMVDRCDRLAALWNGTGGGTANCVFYAQKVGKPIDHLWDRYEADLPADLWGLLS